MRVVVQRVSQASVVVDGATVATIGWGLAVLVGVSRTDTPSDALAMAAKLVGLRIFPDEAGKMNRSVADIGGSLLVVSQFTLYGDARRGRRPSFTEAADPEWADALIADLGEQIRAAGMQVQTGRFGATMQVRLVNEGPVTLLLETREGRFV